MLSDKKIKVAVIDSGIDMSNLFFKDKHISCLKVDKDKIVGCNADTNGHGTLVTSYILRECENVAITSIQILNKDNNSSIDKLIKAIDYCIESKIDIINLSLGIHDNNDKIDILRLACNKAISNGTLIFTSHSNIGNVSYPASFKNVIGVSHDNSIEDNILKVNKCTRDIIFSTPLLSMNHFGISASKSGSSFLCPYILGIFCKYIYHYKIDIQKESTENLYDLFLNFIDLLNEDYKYKIFNLFPSDFNDKRVIFYPNNKTNQNIVETYSNIFASIKLYNSNYDCLYSKLEKDVDKVDLIAIGNIDYKEDRRYIKSLIQEIKRYDIDIFIRYPFISTFDRYILSKETGKNVYCQHL